MPLAFLNRLSLRQRTLLSTAVMTLVIIGILALASYQILLDSYLELEQDDAAENIARLQNGLAHQIDTVRLTAADWSHWDATYNYIADRNPEYVDENLSDTAFQTLNNHVFVLLDVDGEVVFGKYYDLERGEFRMGVPPELEPFLVLGQPLFAPEDQDLGQSGIVMLGAQPLIVAAYSILDSHNNGPSRGTLIWGQYLDEAAIESLGEMTELPVELVLVDAPGAPADVTAALSSVSFAQPDYTYEIDMESLGVYTLVSDVNGDPAFLLRAIMERRIVMQGWRTLAVLLTAMSLVAILLGAIGAFQLERSVLAPLARLSQSVTKVESPSERVALEGSDELGQVAISINGMLKALEASEVALRESEDRYRRLVEYSPQPVGVHVNGTLVYINQAGATLFGGGTPEELIGRNILDFAHPDDHATIIERIRHSYELREAQPLVALRVLRADGTMIDVEAVSIPILYHGQPATQVMVQDVTERMRSELALRDAHDQLQATLDALPDLMFILDADGRIYDYRAPRETLLYAPPETFLARTVNEVLPEPTAAIIMQAIEEALRDGHSQPVEYELDTFEGHRWFELSVAARGQRERSEARLVALARDVTERKAAEDVEREQRALFEALGSTAAALTSTLDVDEVFSRILSNISQIVPHDAANIMLIEDDSARIVRWRAATHAEPADLDSIRFPLADTLSFSLMIETHKPIAISNVNEFPGWVEVPATAWIRSFVAAPISIDGEVVGFINLDSETPGFFNEVHAERLQALANQAALALRNARLYSETVLHAQALAESNRELDAFSYTVAHDLKSPLQVIIGYTDLLRTDYHSEMSSEAINHIATVEAFAYKMSHMIESLLLLSQLRSAEQAIRHCEMQPVVEAAMTRLEHKMKVRGVKLELPATYPPVMGYAPWLEEIFANFIENAIKYMGDDNPTPVIGIRAKEAGDKVRYEVYDNGVGIKPEDQPRLWEMFTRFHLGKTSGAGLGLSIVRRIITKLNGEVGAESTPGEGSIFWFMLPAVQESLESAAVPDAQ